MTCQGPGGQALLVDLKLGEPVPEAGESVTVSWALSAGLLLRSDDWGQPEKGSDRETAALSGRGVTEYGFGTLG